MLVLQRNIDESITILLPEGRKIVVTLTDVRSGGRSARIGFECDTDIKIWRTEIYNQGIRNDKVS